MKNNLFFRIKYLCWSLFFLIISTCDVWAGRCRSVNGYVQAGSGSNFILAGPFKIISNVVSKVSRYSWDTFSLPLQGVVVIGTAVYIAMYILKNVGSFSKQDTLSFLTKEKGGIIPLCAKMAFIVALLNNQEFIYSTIISPFVTSSLLLGKEFGGGGGTFSSASFGDANSVDDLFALVSKQAQELNDRIYTIVAKGQFLYCNATNPSDGWGIFSWEWRLLPFALILFVIGWFIVIGAAFNILDILIRLGVACIVLPLAIACSISKYTSKYANSAWQLFINCCFSFIVIGMLVLVANKIIDEVLSSGNAGFNIFNIDYPSKDQVEAFADSMRGSFFKLMTLTVICSMIILNMFNDIENITSGIAGGGSIGSMGGKVGGAAVNKMQSVAKQPLKFAGTVAKEGGKMLGETKAGQAVKKGMAAARSYVKAKLRIK